MSSSPMQQLASALRQNGLIRFIEHFAELFPTTHMKDLIVDRMGPHRIIEVAGKKVVNFGSDSFLGLDQDPRVQDALRRGIRNWGTHNGASRLLQRSRQHRRRGQAGRLAGNRSDPDLSVCDAGQRGRHPRTGRPARRAGRGRAGAQFHSGRGQDRQGQRHPRPRPSRTAIRRHWRKCWTRLANIASPWWPSTASTA